MMNQFADEMTFVEAIDFDDDRHCLFVSRMSGLQDPMPMADKMREYISLAETAANTRDPVEVFMRQTELLLCPVSIPKVDAETQADASKIVVMSPTPGHTATVYNFLSADDRLVYLSNQSMATGWEITRQALMSLGATVVVSDDIYERNGIAPVLAQQGVHLPVQQAFTRDSGTPIDDLYLTPDEDILYRMTVDVMQTSNGGIRIPRDSRLDKMAQLMAGLRPYNAEGIVRAFRRAGANFQLKEINAFFEGGDVISDPRKGVIFIGNDPRYNNQFRSLHGNTEKLHGIFSSVAGDKRSVIVIDRPFTEQGKGRGDGERYHLDCFMVRLPKGEMLVDPRFTTQSSLNKLQTIYGNDLILIDPDNPTTIIGPVGTGDVPNYPANLVSVGHTLLMPTCSPALMDKLQRRGYRVITAEHLGVPPGVFYMRGGGMDCITQDSPFLCP